MGCEMEYTNECDGDVDPYLLDGNMEVELCTRHAYGIIIDDSMITYPRNANELLTKGHHHRTSDGVVPIPPGPTNLTCEAWFDVKRDDGTVRSFDCSRMIAEGGRLDR